MQICSEVVSVSTFGGLHRYAIASECSLHVYHELMVHVCQFSLWIVHSCTFTSMQWDNEVQFINKTVNVTEFSTFDWIEVP